MSSAGSEAFAGWRRLGRDPSLGPVIERVGPPPVVRPRGSHFHRLAQTVLSQQLAGSAAQAIYQRVVRLYPERRFPTPERLLSTPPRRLRAAGVSRQKESYLRDLARKYTDGTLHPRRLRRLGENELIAHLTQVRGVGEWTVHIFMIYALSRPDVLPVGDYGVRRGVQRLFDLRQNPDRAQVEELAEPWRPHRSAASWYLWRVAEGA